MRRASGWRCVVPWLAACVAAPVAAQQDATAPRQSPILEFPDLGPIPGTTTQPPLPGSLAPSMGFGPSPTSPGPMGGKRRTGRLPRGAKPTGLASSALAARGIDLPE
ncbi:MAG: hypothetical protein ACKOHG_11670, partial [Planctomycetia bacterium]